MLKNDSGTTIIEASVSVRTLPTPDPVDPDPVDPDPVDPDPSVSTDATLSSLSLSGIDLRLGGRLRPFSPEWDYYEASVADDVTETTVTATVNHSGASYEVKLGGVVDDDGVIPLREGISVITIVVTAEDGVTTRIYTVRVTRGELPETPTQPTLSNDATLSALTLSRINFGIFNSAITSYSAQVANDVAQTTVTPILNHSGASYEVKLDGIVDADRVIPLAVGSNVITIAVTAEDEKTTRSYTVTVTRIAPTQVTPTPVTGDLPTDDPPVNFRVTSYDHAFINIAWGVPRDRGITNYTLKLYEHDGNEFVLLASRDSETNGGIEYSGSRVVEPDTQYKYVLMLKNDSGTTIIEASVSVRTLPTPDPVDPDPVDPDPSVSTDATLSSLSLSGIDLRLGGRLRPFSPEWDYYEASVADDVTETTVTATVNDPEASYVIKLGGVVDDDGVIPLAVGSSVITIAVTAEDGVTTRIYTVRVTRGELPEPSPQSTLAALSGLTLSGIDFGTFDDATTSYSAQVPNEVEQTTVTPTLNHSGASYVIKLNGVADDGVIPLAVGSNDITIEVTAEDEETTRSYTVRVTRAAPTQVTPAPVTDEETPTPVTGDLPTDDPPVNFRVTGYAHDWVGLAWEVPRDRGITNYVLQRYESDGSASPFARFARSEGETNGGAGYALSNSSVEPDTQYSYVLMLKNDSGTTIIESSVSFRTLPTPDPVETSVETSTPDPSDPTVETSTPDPSDPTNATLSSLSLSGIGLRLGDRLQPFSSGRHHYDAIVAADVTETTVTATVNHSGASYVIKLGGVVDDDGVIPLREGISAITIVVTAEDGVTTRIYTVRVTRGELPETSTQTPHSLTQVSGDGQEGPANTQLAESFVVLALDEDGVAMTGVVVSFSVTAGGGMLSATTDANPCTIESSTSSTTATTDANGHAAIRLTLGSEPGTNTVEATVAGESETFTATAAEQTTSHSLTKVCGDDQEGTAGALLAAPFVVSVSDEDGAAVAGVVVSFSVTAGGGTLSAATATTDVNGRARTWLTLGSELGTNTVEATVEGLEPVTFTAIGQESPLVSLFDAFLGRGKLVGLPDGPQLAQNAPNPFNSQTVLSYFLLEPGLVRLEVFTLTGQRVAVLHQDPQQAGYHRLHWDGRDDVGRPLASGTYLYRLVTDEIVLTRKLTLLR